MVVNEDYKFLAHAGLGSRRSCEQLVLESKIRVNGKIIRDLATDIDSQNDIVEYKIKNSVFLQTKYI